MRPSLETFRVFSSAFAASAFECFLRIALEDVFTQREHLLDGGVVFLYELDDPARCPRHQPFHDVRQGYVATNGKMVLECQRQDRIERTALFKPLTFNLTPTLRGARMRAFAASACSNVS